MNYHESFNQPGRNHWRHTFTVAPLLRNTLFWLIIPRASTKWRKIFKLPYPPHAQHSVFIIRNNTNLSFHTIIYSHNILQFISLHTPLWDLLLIELFYSLILQKPTHKSIIWQCRVTFVSVTVRKHQLKKRYNS